MLISGISRVCTSYGAMSTAGREKVSDINLPKLDHVDVNLQTYGALMTFLALHGKNLENLIGMYYVRKRDNFDILCWYDY